MIDEIIVHELAPRNELNPTPALWNVVSVQEPMYTKLMEWSVKNGSEIVSKTSPPCIRLSRSRFQKVLVRPKLLALWVSTEFCQVQLAKNAIGVTVPKLNQIVIGKSPVALPLVQQRDNICNAIYGTNRQLKALDAETHPLDERFRAVLEELMSGRLSVAPLFQEVVA